MRRICKLLPKVTKNAYPQKNYCTSCNTSIIVKSLYPCGIEALFMCGKKNVNKFILLSTY